MLYTMFAGRFASTKWLDIMLPAYVHMRRFDFFLVLLAIGAVSLQTATSCPSPSLWDSLIVPVTRPWTSLYVGYAFDSVLNRLVCV